MNEIGPKKGAQEEPDEEEYKLWKLAAIYGFKELEIFLRKRCEKRIYKIVAIEGIWKLRDEVGISSDILNQLVRTAATSHLNKVKPSFGTVSIGKRQS